MVDRRAVWTLEQQMVSEIAQNQITHDSIAQDRSHQLTRYPYSVFCWLATVFQKNTGLQKYVLVARGALQLNPYLARARRNLLVIVGGTRATLRQSTHAGVCAIQKVRKNSRLGYLQRGGGRREQREREFAAPRRTKNYCEPTV